MVTSAVRGVYLASGATLSGFTVTDGATFSVNASCGWNLLSIYHRDYYELRGNR